MARNNRPGPEDAREPILAYRLHSVAIGVLRQAREADRESELSPARLSALSVLVHGGPRSASELAAAEQVTPPTMTRILQGLEHDGLVKRTASSDDKRVSVVQATAAGARALDRARDARLGRIGILLEGTTDSDRARIGAALSILERQLARDGNR